MVESLGKCVAALEGNYSICEILKGGKVVGYVLVAPNGRWVKEGTLKECQDYFDGLPIIDEPYDKPKCGR